MVLAVEAGHRMDKKGVVKWMLATIIGGFFFLGSQAWEWSHFIHGTEFGRVALSDGSSAVVKGEFGKIESFTVIEAGHHAHGMVAGDEITNENIDASEVDLMHAFQHAASAGHLHATADGLTITLHDGTKAKVNKEADKNLELLIKEAGSKYSVSLPSDVSTRVSGEEAISEYYEALSHGNVIYGANLEQNEYGPKQYGQFFFFITGFHGFHVFSGVIINILIFVGVLKGIYHKRGHYEMVEKTGLYWHFVDLVWVFVFTFFYLI
jgi:cytochrome c oxidase subunit 3